MKTLLSFIVLLFTTPAFGQTIEQLQAKAKDLKANKDLIIAYDKYKDLSQVLTKPYNLVGTMEGGAIEAFGGGRMAMVLVVDARYIFRGQKFDHDSNKLYLEFASMSKDWRYLKGDNKAYILYDDKRLELRPVAGDSNVHALLGDVSVSETILFEISREDLAAIAAAKDVSFKLNDKPRKFKSELLERFQKLLAVTAQ